MTPLLETERLTKTFGGLVAVDSVDLRLEAGELRCVIGPNGCGKSTLFNLISGLHRPSGGRICFQGREITGQPIHAISKMGIGRKFQVPTIFNELTVYQNVLVSTLVRRDGSLFGGRRATRAQRQRAGDVLRKIDLEDRADEVAMNLSHGQKQWLEIGMVVARQPRLMLLDEPTAGMTVAETHATAKLVRSISEETGISIIVIEHDIGFVKEMESRVTVMYKGTIFKEGNYAEIQADEEIKDIYLGHAEHA